MINSLLAGDVWLAPSLSSKKSEVKVSLKEIVQDNSFHIFICNLEAPFKSEGGRPSRRALLCTEPGLLDSLKIADKNVLNLANNHISDFGEDGLLRTIDGCKERGFLVVGAGANLNEARQPLIVEILSRKIAIISYAETASYVGSIAATKRKAGIAPLEIDLILEDIADIRKRVDDIWVFLHWGKEFIRYPMIIQRNTARQLVEGGATMLIGHHPHVVVGSEKINNVNIYYSLGNFIFPNIPLQDKAILKWSSICRKSMVLKVSLRSDSWFIDRNYLYLDNSGVPKLNKNDEAAKRFEKLSTVFEYADYSRMYDYYFTIEKIRNISRRIIRIDRLLKDLRWYFNRKSAE